MTLRPSDQVRLRKILELAQSIEQGWPKTGPKGPNQAVKLHDDERYQSLKAAISDCKNAEAEELRRLADRANHLHNEISLQHLYACIVPFERLAGKSLRDDEFLGAVAEGDKKEKAQPSFPTKLIVENLRSAFNVGALFRTSECLGISEIILCGYTPGPDDEKTAKTSMGTAEEVRWRRTDRAKTACEELKKQGYKIIALETAMNSTSLTQIKFENEKTAFLVGNERFGIDADTLQLADEICRIPLRGVKNSLNVGIAFGIVAFEWLRQHEANQ